MLKHENLELQVANALKNEPTGASVELTDSPRQDDCPTELVRSHTDATGKMRDSEVLESFESYSVSQSHHKAASFNESLKDSSLSSCQQKALVAQQSLESSSVSRSPLRAALVQ